MPGVPLDRLIRDLERLAGLGELHAADVYLAQGRPGATWRIIVAPRSDAPELEVRGDDWAAVVAAAVRAIREVG